MLSTKLIGNRITDARKKVNMSQAQLAEQLFISSQAVGKWERGESMPDIITLNRLAELLGVDLNYFSGGTITESGESMANTLVNEPEDSPAAGTSNTKKEKAGKKITWDMSRGNWVDADFSGLKNLHEKFGSSNMQRCLFKDSELSGLLLSGNNISECNFTGSEINNSQIRRSNLEKNFFNNCSLQETEFSGSYISGCDFSNADLSGATIKSGGFEKNIVSDTAWNRTSFISTQLADILFEGKLEDCYFEACTFKRVTFQNATLTNTFFKNNDLKRIKFVDCKADRITYEFLKHGKADLSGITLIDL